ncbi:MAG: hypothetical protein Fur0037_03460 [Planctomycetota bacterium]
MQVHLIDGTYELFRAHFGAPPAKAPDGREIGAVRGLLVSLRKLLRDERVTHAACAFDSVIESFRNESFEGYKTGEGLPPELLAQFPLAERASAALGIRTYAMTEYEADDALFSAAEMARRDPRVRQVVLCTPDKDMAQAVRGTEVVTLDRLRGILLDEDGVVRKFGIRPESIPDWLALVGDSADGIPGIPGFGAKTASALLARFPHFEDFPADPKRWGVRGAARLSAVLAERRSDALMFRELATLRSDAPVDRSVDRLEWKGVERRGLEKLCREIGFPRFLEAI